MARKPMKKFGTGKRYADAGTVTKAPEMSLNDIRLRRKTDDILSDYMKAQARHAGNTAKLNIAKAKFEQRNADAKDDDAKRRGADRTATRKGEADAEAALTQARRTRGQSIADRDTAAAKPTTAPADTTATAAKPTTAPADTTATAAKPDYDKMSFGAAFKAARGVEGKPNFTWKGKSYNTNLASSKPAATPAATPARTVTPAATPARTVARTVAPAAGKPATSQAQSRGQFGVSGYTVYGNRDDTATAADGGVIKKFAKGGSIDGCAIRGKTRAGRTK